MNDSRREEYEKRGIRINKLEEIAGAIYSTFKEHDDLTLEEADIVVNLLADTVSKAHIRRPQTKLREID